MQKKSRQTNKLIFVPLASTWAENTNAVLQESAFIHTVVLFDCCKIAFGSSRCELGQSPCFCVVYAVGSQLINTVAQVPAFLNCVECF